MYKCNNLTERIYRKELNIFSFITREAKRGRGSNQGMTEIDEDFNFQASSEVEGASVRTALTEDTNERHPLFMLVS